VTGLVRACLIDVYDTILQSSFLERTQRLIEPLGLDLDDWLPEWEKSREDRDRGRMSNAAALARVLGALGLEPEPGLVAGLARRDAELLRAEVRLCPDTVPFLTWLRSAGMLTALVSNCTESTRGLLDHLGILPLVDAAVLSCEIGSVKPYPEIYVTALEELGVAAVDAVFIDDQPAFCMGAQAVGLRAIQIARGASGGGTDSRWDFPRVRSFDDVKPLL
jgi:putative hydrolase of the HAD superfamily